MTSFCRLSCADRSARTHGSPALFASIGIIAHRFDEEDPTMSPSYFAVRNAELDEKIEAARLAGDFPRVYNLLAEQTSLLRAMYGQPAG